MNGSGNPFGGVIQMCPLLEKYTAAMAAGDPATARDSAYQMLQILNGLYHAAYFAAVEKAAQQRKPQ
jgi:hypothetical protein